MINTPVSLWAGTALVVSEPASTAASTGDLWATLLQLGIGGVFVVFGASIYRRFEMRSDKTALGHRQEIDALTAKHSAELAAERAEHARTRETLFNLLSRKEH